MDNITEISSFVRKLNEALTGDLSGWKLAYELSDGLRRYCLRDDDDRVYDAYVCGRCCRVYDPDMRVIA